MRRQIDFKLDALRSDRYQVTTEGFLTCEAAVTRAGVFDYRDETGKLIRELRPAEEVFSKESLASLRMIPITFLHPDELRVTVDNNRNLSVGMTGENITHDDQYVSCMVKITDKHVVAYVLDRHRQGKDVELSCGYDAEILPSVGKHPKDGHYDVVQKNIRYNHLSIVPKGRAGENVKLKLDTRKKERASDPSDKIAGLTRRIDAFQARIDALESQVKALRAENSTLADPAGDRIQRIVKERIALETAAARLGIQTDGLSDRAVKVAVIRGRFHQFRADGRSDDCIDARFDMVVEMLDDEEKANRSMGLAQVIRDARGAGVRPVVDHRAEFIRKTQELVDR